VSRAPGATRQGPRLGRLERFLNRPGLGGRLWRLLYEAGYACLRLGAAFTLIPLFHVRRVGPRARLPRRGGVLLCPNHASYLDPAFVQLLVRRRLTFVMTTEFYEKGWGNWFFRLVGAIPVGTGRRSLAAIRRASALVRRGHAVVVFPEGRLTRDGTVGTMHRGISLIARRTGAPVHPAGIVGSFTAWPHGAARPVRCHVRVAFGAPLTWAADPDSSPRQAEAAFAERLRERICALVAAAAPHCPTPTPERTPSRGLQGSQAASR
jgi:1-acyl-sn-glycerol-3-phosphate acyltransferase